MGRDELHLTERVDASLHGGRTFLVCLDPRLDHTGHPGELVAKRLPTLGFLLEAETSGKLALDPTAQRVSTGAPLKGEDGIPLP